MYDIEQYRASNTIDIFYDVINDNRFIKHYKTGFLEIDKVTSGGFETGFGIINGVSGAGKTTLITQIANNMSEYGQSVIIFSLEMEKTALLAKSISMQSFKDNTSLFTANEILSKNQMDYKSDKEKEDYRRIALNCGEITKNLIIVDRNTLGTSISADIVIDFTNDYIKQTNTKPVIFIDYLQRLAPSEDKKSCSKQEIIDDSIDKLWGYSHQNELCIVAISSLNRMSYKEGATLEGNKGSGNIEYSADFGLGIQFEGFDQPNFNFNEAKKAPVRKIELVVLKQRLGSAGYAIPYDYYAAYNIFVSNDNINNNTSPLNILENKDDLSTLSMDITDSTKEIKDLEKDDIDFICTERKEKNDRNDEFNQFNFKKSDIIYNEDEKIEKRDIDIIPQNLNPFKKQSNLNVDFTFDC